jgi:hypothetical protein
MVVRAYDQICTLKPKIESAIGATHPLIFDSVVGSPAPLTRSAQTEGQISVFQSIDSQCTMPTKLKRLALFRK